MTPRLLSYFGLLSLTGLATAQIVQTEPNDSIATATPSTLVAGSSGGVLSLGNNGDGPFGPTTGDSTGDYDFFAIPANAGQVIIFDVNANINGSGMDSLIGLYDSSGTLLASNDDDGTSRDSLINFTTTADDTYYAVVGNWIRGAADDAGSLPTDANTAGTGRGVPGGAVDDYEVVILLDGESYLTRTQPNFPLGGPGEVVEGEITLTNLGAADAVITAINFSGDGASAFDTSQTLPLTIAAGGTATVNLSFTPNGSSEAFEANLELVSNDIVHPTFSVPLSERAIDGLVFRLPFDDPADSPTGAFGSPAEATGNGFQAALVVNAGAPPPTYGRPPLAGTEGFSTMLNDADSSGNYILTANNFPHPASFTYSLWVRPTAGAGDDTLFNRDEAFTQNDNIFGCTITAGGAVLFRIQGTEILLSEDGVVPDDSTHHIVVTHLDTAGYGDFEADRTRLYVDGVMLVENTETFEIPEYTGNGNSRLWIGTRSAAGTGFNGDMDEFQFYNKELDGEQVMRLFTDPTTPITSDPPAPLAITDIARSEDGTEVNLTFASSPGRTYFLETSTDLINWAEIADSIESEGASTSFTAPGIDPDASPLFFRVAVE